MAFVKGKGVSKWLSYPYFTSHCVALQVLAVEVLWTPQDDGDYFSRDDLATDYPTLNTL